MSGYSSQGGGTANPPIPTMGQAAPAPPATVSQIRQQVRDIAKQAKQAAQEAKAAAQGTANAPATPAIATSTAPPAFDASNLIPQQAVDISLAFFFTVAFCVVGFPIARALARWVDRRGSIQSSSGPDTRPQIQQLQQSVDAMALEIERISEGQRFTTKVLTERAGSST